MYKFKITSIVCNGTQENGNDEVVIYFQSDAGIPMRYPMTGYQRMNTTADSSNDVVKTWNISDLEIMFNNESLVTLYDMDGADHTGAIGNEPSFLINKDYNANNLNGSFSKHNHNGANYTINTTAV